MNRKLATLAVSAAILIGGATMAAAQDQGNGRGGGGGGAGRGGDAAFSRLDIGPFTHVRPVRPPRPNRPLRRIRPKADSDCTCRLRRVRVNGYLQTVRDCYELVRINGRIQVNYCAR